LKYTWIKLLFLVIAAPGILLRAQEQIDGIAAIVGDDIILKSDVLQLAQMTALQNSVDLQRNPAFLQVFQSEALNVLITQKILLDRAKVDSLDEVSTEEVDQALEMQISNLLGQIGSEAEFEQLMGLRLRDFRQDHWFVVRDQLIAERYQNEKIGRVSVNREEVNAFYETYKDSLPPLDSRYELTQILVPIEAGSVAYGLARSKIERLQERLTQGEDFSSLASEYSDDQASRERGGELGFVRRGELVPEFEETAFNLGPGDLSDIVETTFGFHIITLIDKQGERINVSHILISIDPTPEDRELALSKVREFFFILDDEPALFDSLLTIVSSVFGNSPDLGYIGWIELSLLPNQAYRSALFGLQPGQVSPPFETKDGFHLLKVLNFKEGGSPNLEDYYPQIEALALRNKQSDFLSTWLISVRNDVYINVLE
jgi:peptidyl-prolyl cis-trans isomerase SurA